MDCNSTHCNKCKDQWVINTTTCSYHLIKINSVFLVWLFLIAKHALRDQIVPHVRVASSFKIVCVSPASSPVSPAYQLVCASLVIYRLNCTCGLVLPASGAVNLFKLLFAKLAPKLQAIQMPMIVILALVDIILVVLCVRYAWNLA